MSHEYRFGPWRIWYEPPPIPIRTMDWHYWHDDDDGAPDGSTARSGSTASLEECLSEIAEMVDDECFDCPCSSPDLAGCMAWECPHRHVLVPERAAA